MSKEHTFDVVSEVDLQEVDNAVQQAVKEIQNRFDLKTSQSKLVFERSKKELELSSQDEFKLRSVVDVLQSKLVKRGISLKALQYGKPEISPSGAVRQRITLVSGISDEKSREISKLIRAAYPKVKTQYMGDRVRVTDKNKDVLQSVLGFLKGQDLTIPLQFCNFR